MPAGARDAPRAASAKASAASLKSLPVGLTFKSRAALIIADPTTLPDRLAARYRLPGPNETGQAALRSMGEGLVGKVRRSEDVRGMTFGLDGGSATLGPPVDATVRPAEIVAYNLAEASTCNGLMPNVDCNSIGHDDVAVRLALAFNF